MNTDFHESYQIMKTLILILLSLDACLSIFADEPINIGDRRELFVDQLLIGELKKAKLKLHSPTLLKRGSTKPRPFGHYATVLKDGDKFRLYYRGDIVPGMHWKHDGWGPYHANEMTKYAESKDGYNWTEPNLGLYQKKEVPAGNIVLADQFLVNHNFTPFIDKNPNAPKEERYKAIGGSRYPAENWGLWPDKTTRPELRKKYGVGGLYVYSSPDGIHWKKMQEEAVLAENMGSFDSQNVAFWSEAENQYVSYFRDIIKGYRSIRRSTSKDFLKWTAPVNMTANLPKEHLYTSGTHPYFRAPHIYIALPTRFQANRAAITDVAFMSTRPGNDHYDRIFKEAFIRPGLGPGGWGNRSNYVTWHVVPTSKTEMSMYMYGGGHYVLRTDGFASVNAGYEEGEFITNPLIFSGDKLEINYSTSAAGRMRIELQNTDGTVIEGFSLEDSAQIWGDEISRIVKWKKLTDVSKLAGKPVKIRFVMNEADLYSIRFF